MVCGCSLIILIHWRFSSGLWSLRTKEIRLWPIDLISDIIFCTYCFLSRLHHNSLTLLPLHISSDLDSLVHLLILKICLRNRPFNELIDVFLVLPLCQVIFYLFISFLSLRIFLHNIFLKACRIEFELRSD